MAPWEEKCDAMSKAGARLRLWDDGPPRPADGKEPLMKYMLMMNHPGQGPYQIASWPQEDLRRHIRFMKDFAQKLAGKGELVGAEGLAGPDQAKRVRAGNDGKPITDGVFAETKEFLVG